MAEDVVAVVTINKSNSHTRLEADDMGDVVVQINVCNLTTK